MSCVCGACADPNAVDCPGGIQDALLPVIDDILCAVESVGAFIKKVSLVTRTWYTDADKTTLATTVGGYATDVIVAMHPNPTMKDYSQDIRLREGGAVKQGDIILKNVSKNQYAEEDLDGSTSAPNIEKFYLVGAKLYQVINVTEELVTWRVQLREMSNQTRY